MWFVQGNVHNNENNRIERRNSRFFCKQSLHCAANCFQHVRSSAPGAIVCKSRAAHRALIMCNMSCATWCKRTAQLLSFAGLKSDSF